MLSPAAQRAYDAAQRRHDALFWFLGADESARAIADQGHRFASNREFAALDAPAAQDFAVTKALCALDIDPDKFDDPAYRNRLRLCGIDLDAIAKSRALCRAELNEPSAAQLKNGLLKRLKAEGYLAIRINSGVVDESAGLPDVLALRQGQNKGMIARLFEVKCAGASLTPEQKRFVAYASQFGARVEVVEGRAGFHALEL